MQRRKFSREFKLEAVKVVLERGVSAAQAERDILKRSGCLLREGLDMRFAFIAKHRGIWPVSWICEAPKDPWRGLAQWLSPLAGACAERAFAQ